jgi:hypothetical protein
MKLLKITLLTALILPFLIAGCIEKPVEPVVTVQTVTITGKVLRSDNLAPIPGALVTLRDTTKTPPLFLSARTDSTGTYRLSLQTDASLSAVIVTSDSGFSPDTVTVKVDPGKEYTQPNVYLQEVLATGLPDQAHFTLTVDKRNFPGLVKLEATNTIRVRVGDKSGNPVARGTQINFSTRGGTVDGSGFTDPSGSAQAKLYGGNPVPVDAVYGKGFTWVKAFTVGESGKTVQDSLLVLFSGQTKIVGPASGFTLSDGGTQAFEYSVVDTNGNPLTEGTAIDVTVAGSSDIQATGDISVTLGDTQAKGPESTNFSFTLRDTKPLDTAGDQDLTVTILVTSTNGNRSYTFTGKLLAAGTYGGGVSGNAATIALAQLTRNAISVRGVGGDETSVITFEVRDSLGRPVDQTHQVSVSFVHYFNGHIFPGADSEYVAPTAALSDAQTGRVQTTVNAGTRAGVLQVVAQTTVGSQTIRSAPVIIDIFGGFPVRGRFWMSAKPSEITLSPGENSQSAITVQAGDKYSNPVKPGTAIYFSTTNDGIIPASGYTDDDGFASVNLSVWKTGTYAVTARTLGEYNEAVDTTIYVAVNSPTGPTGGGYAATIALLNVSLNAISVREVGADETSILTFEVRDSLGAPVDALHTADVSFFIQSGPGGGEYVSPTSGLTQGSTGRVQTTLSSGTKAGVVQIVVQTTVGSRTIRSAPVIVNIFGGFPDQAHFSIGSAKLNFPGYDILNLTNTITVVAGDKYSNPVRPGTAVYFRTTGGTINVPSTAYTTDDGIASATLRSGNPRPYDPVLGAGFAYVTASTVGQSGNTVSDSTVVLFSGISQIHGLSATTFAVPAGGSSGPISFKVTDENGNPLSSGTVIALTLQYTPPPNTTINLAITGDINVTLGDVQAKGSGTTDFSFQVVDQTAGGVPTPIPVTVVISVTSPNGKPPNVSISGTVG